MTTTKRTGTHIHDRHIERAAWHAEPIPQQTPDCVKKRVIRHDADHGNDEGV